MLKRCRKIRFCNILVLLLCFCIQICFAQDKQVTYEPKVDFSDLQLQSTESTGGKKVVVNINLMRDSSTSNLKESSSESTNAVQVNINLGGSVSSSARCENEKNQKIDLESFCPKKQWLTNNHLNTTKRFQRVNTKYGNQMFIDSFDHFKSQQLKKDGITYPGNIYLIGHLIKKGAKVLNLGAHNGMESMLVGRAIGPCGHLYIFEPYSASYRVVRKNLEINGILDRATTYNFAAYDKQGQSELHINFDNTGASSVVNLGQKQGAFREKIKLRRVDDVLPQDVQFDFALIDVQRVEANALTGMKKVIQRSPNFIMMVQWQAQINVPLAKQIISFLQGLGYKMYKYKEKGSYCILGDFIEILTLEDLLKQTFIDVIFVPKTVTLPKQ